MIYVHMVPAREKEADRERQDRPNDDGEDHVFLVEEASHFVHAQRADGVRGLADKGVRGRRPTRSNRCPWPQPWTGTASSSNTASWGFVFGLIGQIAQRDVQAKPVGHRAA